MRVATTERPLFRGPERIEIAVTGISVVVLLQVVMTSLRITDPAPDRFTILAGCCAAFLCIAAGSFLARSALRIACLLLLFLDCLMLLSAFGGRSLGAEILLLLLLEVSVSLRFPVTIALAANAAILGFTTLVGVSFGCTAAQRIEVLLFGGLIAYLAEIAVFYRERLVRAANTVEYQSRSLENLAAANHSFVAHLESAKAESAERERLMITRELHDAIGYSLTNIAMMMNAARYLARENPEKLVEYCRKTRELASSTLQETRQILYKLRVVTEKATENPPLFFTRLCQDFAQATGVRTECHLGNLPASLDDRVFTALFRSVQVGFINALRHGSAAHIRLAFWLTDAELQMRVWNDTPIRLPDAEAAGEGIGLRGVRERLEAVSGGLSYGPVPDGYEMVVTIPREETGIPAL